MALDLLFPNFDVLIRKPEDVQRLNEAILQLAVQGKLVAQDPNDEPAEELLKRIKEEKTKYLTRGHDSENEEATSNVRNLKPPFKLPYGWIWVCIGDVSFVRGGKRVPKGSSLIESPTDHIYIRVTDMKNGSIEESDLRYVSDEVYEIIKLYTISLNDLYITIAGTIGKVGIVPAKFDGMNLTENAARLRFVLVNRLFARYVLNSPFAQTQFADRVNQMAQPKLALIRIKTAQIPLPPLSEQERIVAKVDELFAQTRALEARLRQAQEAVVTVNRAALHRLHTAQDADQFQAAWRTIRDHFDVLYDDPRNVAELRQTILDLAVRGKLVPQDANDEPAGELLKQIQVERGRLTAASKIKPTRSLAFSRPEQVPYELPVGWEWTHLPDVGELARGQSKHRPRNDPSLFENGTHPFVQTGDVARAKGPITSYSAMYNDIGLSQSRLWPKGTLCVTIAANIGETGVLGIDACFPDSVVGFLPYFPIDSVDYFHCFLRVAKSQLEGYAPATAQKNINLGILETLLVPLPPLEEMGRIVLKINQLMRLCDVLEARLAQTETVRRRVTVAALQAG